MRDGARLVLGVAALALVLRLPFLGAGYGWDSDAFRVAAAAAAMVETGDYAAPRLPGNPLHDIACALLWALGPAARRPEVLNGASALVAAIGAGAFALAWRRRGLPDAALAGIAAASVPAVFIASVSTLDYAWGFAFVAGALAAAAHRRVALAGAFAALAVATRLTNAGAVLGVGLIFLLDGRSSRRGGGRVDLALYLALAFGAGSLPYLPLWLERGTAALAWYDHGYPAWFLVAKKATVDLWGWIGMLGWAALAAIALGRRGGRAPADRAGAVEAGARGGALLAVLAFLRLPYKAAYLVPAVPLLLAAPRVGRRAARALLVALVLSPWLVSLYVPGKDDDPGPSRWARPVSAFGRTIVVDLRGPILLDQVRRRAGLDYVARVVAAGRRLPPGSALVVQDWLPHLRLALDRARGPVERDGVLYTHLLDRAALEALRADGRALHFLPGVEEANRAKYGVDLVAAGALPLVP